jgi:hypothetical protein
MTLNKKKEIAPAKKSKKAMDYIISFRVPANIYRILCIKSAEFKYNKNPHLAARKIVEDFLMLDDIKTIKMAINNMYDTQQKFLTLIKFMMKDMEYSKYLHFSSHPETPTDQRETVSALSVRRAKEYYKLLMSIEMGKGDTIIEEIIDELLDRGNA